MFSGDRLILNCPPPQLQHSHNPHENHFESLPQYLPPSKMFFYRQPTQAVWKCGVVYVWSDVVGDDDPTPSTCVTMASVFGRKEVFATLICLYGASLARCLVCPASRCVVYLCVQVGGLWKGGREQWLSAHLIKKGRGIPRVLSGVLLVERSPGSYLTLLVGLVDLQCINYITKYSLIALPMNSLLQCKPKAFSIDTRVSSQRKAGPPPFVTPSLSRKACTRERERVF